MMFKTFGIMLSSLKDGKAKKNPSGCTLGFFFVFKINMGKYLV